MAMTVAASRIGMVGNAQAQSGTLSGQGDFPSLDGASGWLNSQPLTPNALRGKVVLVNFCTYSCINWRRSLPYVRAWAKRYKEQGLVVIGVHTPEFEFEKDLGNVRRALQDMGIGYPIALDNGYAIWRAFDNAYWPALYFIDAQGRIRHHQFGEGDYDRSERVIQRLLADAGAADVGRALVAVDAQGVEAPADWKDLKSPENYLGYARTANFASPGGPAAGVPRVYTVPSRLRLNEWALSGNWTTGKQALVLNQVNGRIVTRFHARDLHIVMGAPPGEAGVPFRVRIDGRPPEGGHGLDVDSHGNGTVTIPRLYQLVRQSSPIADRQFEIEFTASGVEAYAFTFG
jgi:thiol-disulfide isomerase/thioredoxin